MLTIFSSFVLKILDNGLSTAKTIYLNKERYVLGALFNALSTFFYLVALVQLTKGSGLFNILAMCFATFIGTYLPGLLIKRSERDKLWIFDVTADTFDSGVKFADIVREKNIAVKTFSSYDSNLNKTLSCKIYCTTKDESRVINDIIPTNFKYNIYIPVHSE